MLELRVNYQFDVLLTSHPKNNEIYNDNEFNDLNKGESFLTMKN